MKAFDKYVEYWRDFVIRISGCSRSLKMAPIDRSHPAYYWSVIVTIALSCTIFELFDVQNIMTLKSRLESLKIIGNGTFR